MAIEERVTGIQLSQENDNLKAEIRDLNEKLETLKGTLSFNTTNKQLVNFDVSNGSSPKSR